MRNSILILFIFTGILNAQKIDLNKQVEINKLDKDYKLAKKYSSKKNKEYNLKKAYNLLVNNANENHAKSQLLLGRFFLIGAAVDIDYEKAMYYFKKASKQKEYDANCYIAYMYASGKGVFPNFGRAHIFAKNEYKNKNKICQKVWKDYNLGKYPKDKGWKIGDYNKPIQ